MIRIGIIDHFLDEWHANMYPGWIRDPRHGGKFDVVSAWANIDSPNGIPTDEWCKRNRVNRALSRSELVDCCDAILVLSPDNPEYHEALSAEALMSGKPVYIDKTFALSLDSAKRMYETARIHKTPLYSTSALRYATELKWLTKHVDSGNRVEFASVRGPGSFATYGIHQIELLVRAMGAGAQSVIAFGSNMAPILHFEYADNRHSIMNHLKNCNFSIALQTTHENCFVTDIMDGFWDGFIDDLLRFFKTRHVSVKEGEVCSAIAMYEAGYAALQNPGKRIQIPTGGNLSRQGGV